MLSKAYMYTGFLPTVRLMRFRLYYNDHLVATFEISRVSTYSKQHI